MDSIRTGRRIGFRCYSVLIMVLYMVIKASHESIDYLFRCAGQLIAILVVLTAIFFSILIREGIFKT